MYNDIFDGVWNIGFINHDTGIIEEDKKSSLYSNPINIKKNTNYIFGFNDNSKIGSCRIRVWSSDGTYLKSIDDIDASSVDNSYFSEDDQIIRFLMYNGLTNEQKTNFYFKEELKMAVKSADQITIVDITDAYSVMLTSEAYTFIGGPNGAAAGQSCSTEAVAYCGSNQCANVEAIAENITCPTGITAKVENSGTSKVKITFTTNAVISTACEASIPVTVDGITINKKFSFAVAKAGQNGTSVTVKSTSVTYQASSSGTETPTGTWQSTIPAVSNGQFLWTKTVVTYSDNKSTTSYSISYKGTNGTSVTVKSTSVTYQASSSGTSKPTGEWKTTIPTVPNGQYLWTKTVVTYSDEKFTEAYSVSYKGTNGKDGVDGVDGQDAITLTITSSNGTVFKNSSGSTTLTAHVFKGSEEQTVQSNGTVSGLGTIKWYKKGNATAISTSSSITVNASDVDNSIVYTCQLE